MPLSTCPSSSALPMMTLEALLIAKIGLELLDIDLPVHVLTTHRETPLSYAAKYRLKRANLIFEDRDRCTRTRTPLMNAQVSWKRYQVRVSD